MNKVLLFGILMLMLLPMAFASSASITSENTTFWASIFNGTTHFDADSALITILNPNGSTFVLNDSMLPISIGVFKYNNFPEDSGNYYISVDFVKNGSFVLTADETMFVAEGVDDMLINITIILILFLIGLGFAWFAERSENYVWYIFGGIWFFAAAPLGVSVLTELNTTFSFLSIAFFWLIALILVYEAVQASMDNKKSLDNRN